MGISVTVADARFAKPLDVALIERLAREHAALITIEEGAQGGFGAHVLAHLANHTETLQRGLKVRTMTLPDVFLPHASQVEQYEDAGLTARDIVSNALELLGRQRPPAFTVISGNN